jgi:hypothetical protein
MNSVVIQESLKDARYNSQYKEASKICVAGEITRGVYVDLIERSMFSNDITVNEQNQIEKYKFKRYYSISQIDIEMLMSFNNGRAKRIYHNLNIILKEPTLEQSLAVLRREEQSKLKELMESTVGNDLAYKCEYEAHLNAVKLLKIVGYDDILSNDELSVDDLNGILVLHDQQIRFICKKFNVYPYATMRNINNILDSMYGYVLSKKKNIIRLKQKHDFEITHDRKVVVHVEEEDEYDAYLS